MELSAIVGLLLVFFVIFVIGLSARSFREKNHEQPNHLRSKVIDMTPLSAKSLHLRGSKYFANKQFDEAIRDFGSAIKLDEGLHEAYFGLLNSLTVQKRLAEFAPFAAQIIRVHPDVAESYNVRGVYFTRLDRYEDALSNYDRSLELSPENPCFLSNKAWMNYRLGSVSEAITTYKHLIKLHPNYQVAIGNYAQILMEENEFEEVLPLINQMVRLDSGKSYNYYLRAYTYHKLKNYTLAMNDVQKAINLESRPDYYIERGYIYFCLDEFEKALNDYCYGLETMSVDSTTRSCALVDRGEVYVVLDRIDEAHADAQTAYKLEADSKYAISLLALTSFIRGEIDEAQRLWRDMVELDERYMDVEWTVEDLGWKDRLVTETEKLIATF